MFEPVTMEHRNGKTKTAYSAADVVRWKFQGYKPATAADAAAVEEQLTPFDPAEHSAKDVHAKLTELFDEGNTAEYDRIVAAEQANQNRTTAIPS